MYGLFPRLRERARNEAGVLSGGEQQMLTLARTMMAIPSWSSSMTYRGLAPMIVKMVAEFLQHLRNAVFQCC